MREPANRLRLASRPRRTCAGWVLRDQTRRSARCGFVPYQARRYSPPSGLFPGVQIASTW